MTIKIGFIEDNAEITEVIETYLVSTGKFVSLFKLTQPQNIKFKTNQIKKADIVICDIGLPHMSGIEVVWHLKQINPQLKVLMLTVFDDDDNIFKAIKAGASGYLLKNTTLPAIEQAILEICNGGASMSPEIALKVLEHYRHPKVKKSEINNLTSRELQITQMLYQGYKYKDIAHSLSVSVDTIKFHVKNIYLKLQIDSRAQLVKFFH